MNIEQGLFKLELTDYHAILGVSLEADAKQVRKRYLKIARRLHPDSMAIATDDEKRQASELLSKFVNPAYEKLTQEKSMAEHKVVLRMQGQQLSRRGNSLDIQTAEARALLGTNDALSRYNNSLKKLADSQYDSLDQVSAITGQISELNLAYLASSSGSVSSSAQAASSSAGKTAQAAIANQSNTPPPPPSPRQQRQSIISSYLNRSKEFALKRDYDRAILEMREAIKSHPNNAPCHSQLASLYQQAGQSKMARIHLKRALDINPKDATAKELESQLGPVTPKSSSKQASSGAPSKSRGGLFGLFGGNQK